MSDHARFESTYADYNRVLRTWFVAFGAGTPGALLLSVETRVLVAKAEYSALIIWAFAIGVILQISLAVLNKYIAWCNAYIEDKKEQDESTISYVIHVVADLTDKIWIDLLADLITLVLFGYAIIRLFVILA